MNFILQFHPAGWGMESNLLLHIGSEIIIPRVDAGLGIVIDFDRGSKRPVIGLHWE